MPKKQYLQKYRVKKWNFWNNSGNEKILAGFYNKPINQRKVWSKPNCSGKEGKYEKEEIVRDVIGGSNDLYSCGMRQ